MSRFIGGHVIFLAAHSEIPWLYQAIRPLLHIVSFYGFNATISNKDNKAKPTAYSTMTLMVNSFK